MEITLKELLAGKPTRIKNNDYFSTEQYVTPFLDRMSKYTDDFRVQVKLPDQITKTVDGSINMDDITFNRVNIEAILPDEYEYLGHKRVVGFVYALDTRKPVVKQYIGALRSACLNLCVFNPDALSVQLLEPEMPIDYSFLINCMSITDNINSMLTSISKMEFSKEECFKELGMWVNNCLNPKKNYYCSAGGKVKLPETLPVDVYKNLFYNDKSEYYSSEGFTNGFNIYNAFTDIICNNKRADIVNRFEKTYLVKEIMGI